jgi:hypothetical protein
MQLRVAAQFLTVLCLAGCASMSQPAAPKPEAPVAAPPTVAKSEPPPATSPSSPVQTAPPASTAGQVKAQPPAAAVQPPPAKPSAPTTTTAPKPKQAPIAQAPAASSKAATSPAAPAATAAAQPAAPAGAPTLDLTSLEQRLRDTKAIGVFTKLSLKNQVDDLLGDFRDLYKRSKPPPGAEFRQRYDLLLLKVLTLLQDGDPPLATAISSSKEAIWSILCDPDKLAKI